MLSRLDPPVYFAVINARENVKAAKRFNVKSFPAFKYFHRGHPLMFEIQANSFEEFYNWAYKKVQPPVKSIYTKEELWEY